VTVSHSVLIAELTENNEIIPSCTLFSFSVTFSSPPRLLELTTLENLVFTGEVRMLRGKDVTLLKRNP
jgi:hypothetical protein